MKIAIITDQHFGSRGNNKVIRENQIRFYEEIFFPKILDEGITTVFDLGDTYDSRQSINLETVDIFQEKYFDPLIKDIGAELYTIVGNHTAYYRNDNRVNTLNTLLRRSYPDIKIIEHKPEKHTFDGQEILFCPWINRQNFKVSMDAIEKTTANTVMGHFEIEGFQMYKNVPGFKGGLSRKVFNRFDMVLSGHFHHKSKEGVIEYLGAPYEMNWHDHDDSRGFHILDTENMSLEFVENTVKSFLKVAYDDRNFTLEDIENLDTKPYYNTFTNINVKHKDDGYLLDKFVEKIESVAHKVTVDEVGIKLSDVDKVADTKDTLEIVYDTIEHYDLDNDKKTGVRKKIEDLHQRALKS